MMKLDLTIRTVSVVQCVLKRSPGVDGLNRLLRVSAMRGLCFLSQIPLRECGICLAYKYNVYMYIM